MKPEQLKRTFGCWTRIFACLTMACGTVLLSGPQGRAAQAGTDENWIGLNPSVRADGPVYGSAVDGSGNLYICGSFTAVGEAAANGLAKWDGTRWSTLGSGVNGYVSALVVVGNDVYAAGAFTTAGGLPATNIAKWDGTNWSAVGAGVDVTDPYAFVTALAVSGSYVYAAVGTHPIRGPSTEILHSPHPLSQSQRGIRRRRAG